MAFTNLTLFGVIPRPLRGTVSYGTLTLYMATRHVVLGIQPGKLGAWLFSRNAVLGMSPGKLGANLLQRSAVLGISPGKAGISNVSRAAILRQGDSLYVNTARRVVIMQEA